MDDSFDQNDGKANKGFRLMPKWKRTEIARKGGKASHGGGRRPKSI